MKIPRRLIAFVVIWLFIYCVPAVRHQATRALQSGPWPFDAFTHTQALRDDYVFMVQDYPDDPRIWVCAARQQPAVSVVNDYDYDDEEEDEEEDANAERIKKAQEALASLFPGTPWKEIQTEPPSYQSPNPEIRRRLDLVSARFPNEAWIIAMRLRLSWGYMYGDRIGGELSDSKIYENKAAGKPSLERSENKPNYTQADLKQVLALCRRGQKLEPNNAFYDWTLAYFLAQSWRDEEAWKALDSAARKTQWNSHRMEELEAKIAMTERLSQRRMTWEEKTAEFWGATMPELSRFREFARIISWQSVKAQRKGDAAQALRFSGNLAKIGSVMRNNSYVFIEGLVAVAINSIGLGSPTYDVRQATGIKTRTMRTAFLNGFVQYARQHHAKELAVWAAADTQKSNAFRAAGNSPTAIGGISYQAVSLLGLLALLQTVLLLLMPAAFYGWLFLLVVFCIRPVRRWLQWDATYPALSKREILRGAVACGGLRALGGALCGAVILGLTYCSFMLGTGHGDKIWQSMQSVWNDVTSGITAQSYTNSFWEGIAYTFLNLSDSIRPLSSMADFLIPCLPVLFGITYCFNRAVVWQEKLANGDERGPGFWKGIFTGRIFLHAEDYDWQRLVVWFARGCVFAALCIAYGFAIFYPPNDSAVWIPVVLGVLFLVVLAWECVHRWQRGQQRCATVRFALKLLRESWLGWLTLGSALFLFLVLCAWPLRVHAEDKLDELIKMGEVKMSSL